MTLGIHVIADVGISASTGVGGIALLCASRGSHFFHVAMTLLHHFSCLKMTANRASALFFALFRAGRGFRLCPSAEAVTLSIHIIADVGIAAGAGVGSITLFCASRSGHLCRVFMRMRQHRNRFLSRCLANGASIGADTRRFFGRILRHHTFSPAVSVRSRVIAEIHISAGAGIGRIALHRAGRCRHRRGIGMSRRADVMTLIRIAANTGMRRITACRTSRRCDRFRIVMDVCFLERVANGAFHTAIGRPVVRMIGIKGIPFPLIVNHGCIFEIIFDITRYGRYFCIDTDGADIGQQNAVCASGCDTVDCRWIVKINGFEYRIVKNACMEGTDRSAKTDHGKLRAGIKRVIVDMTDIALERDAFHIETVGKRSGFDTADLLRNRQSRKRRTVAKCTRTDRRNRFGNRKCFNSRTIIQKASRNACDICRKFKFLKRSAVGKDMPIHTAETNIGIFKFDFFQTRTPTECGIADACDVLTERHLSQIAAPCECIRSDRCQRRGEIHVIKISCRTESTVSKIGNAIGNGIGIRRSAAGIVDQRFHILAEKDTVHVAEVGIRIVNVNGSQIFAIRKCGNTDRGDLFGKRDGGNTVAGAECRISDTCDPVGNDDRLQIIGIEEHTVGNGSHTCGELDVTQIGIVAENTAVDRRYRVGKLQSRQCNTFGKRTAVEAL